MAGRPTEYDPKLHPLMVENLCYRGYIDEEIAEELGIAVSTFYEWKRKYPEFSESVKRGKESIDDRVENALLRRAIGYSHDAVKIFQYEGSPLEVPYVEKYAPDPTSMIFWLKNRRPDRWRDRQELNVDSQSSIRIVNDAHTDDSNIEIYTKNDASS